MASNTPEPIGESRREDAPQEEKAVQRNFDMVAHQSEAANATTQEHALTLRQAFKMYPKACLWSIAISMVIIMEGYDTILVRPLVPKNRIPYRLEFFFLSM